MGRLGRAFTCAALGALSACRVAEYTESLTVAVQPRTLSDDGAKARIAVTAIDRYGDPGAGVAHVTSSAGSLRQGIDLVLSGDGSAVTELTCESRKDPDCVGTIHVVAEWDSIVAGVISKDVAVSIHTTDAFVSACAFKNRRVLRLLTGAPPIIQLAVLDTQPEVVSTTLGASMWDSTSAVGAIALNLPSRGATVANEEQLIRDALSAAGTLSNPLTQTFTTWDGFPGIHTNFDLDVGTELEAQLSAMSTALAGIDSGLSGSTGKSGPFKGEMVLARHGDGQTAAVIALHEASTFSEASVFDLEDVAGGSALSFAVDAPVDHCEIFTVQPGKKVDFVWVVDDSCSMASSQTAVATVGVQAGARIASAQLDFQAAGVSTGYYAPSFRGSYHSWTTSVVSMLSWFSGSSAWGTNGDGDERGFQALTTFMDGNLPGTAFHPESEVHIIFLTDTHDQSILTAQQMKARLDARFPGQHVVVSGIVCPEGDSCGDEPEDPVGKYHTLIRLTGGVLGSIKVFNPTVVTPALKQQQTDTMNRIVGSVVNGAGYQLQYKPITASLRVAASGTKDGRCDNTDIPRSTTDGWDLDPNTGRIAFYGTCVPQLGGTMVVSYKSWARYGTQLHETMKPLVSVGVPDDAGGFRADAGTDAGTPDGGTPDGGPLDSGTPDGGETDAGDGG